MENEELYDISAVCEMLGITSRTLRFYEEKGIIKSTKHFSNRRKYSKNQLELIKKILVLRSLGLSVSQISEIQKGDSELAQAIIGRKSEIIAKLAEMSKTARLLDNALNVIQNGGDIFEPKLSTPERKQIQNAFVAENTEAFIKGEYEKLFNAFGKTMQKYTPLSALQSIIADALLPLGEFISLERIERDCGAENVYYSLLRYEKLGLRIKFVVFEEKINGLWLSYYEL